MYLLTLLLYAVRTPTNSLPLILNSTLPLDNDLAIYPPSSKLNRLACCFLFNIISPELARISILSPTNELPPTIPPVAYIGMLANAAIIALIAAIALIQPTMGVCAAELAPSAIALACVALVAAIMIRYQVEGDQNMPFNLSKMVIVSTAEGVEAEGKNKWNFNVYQNNDVYITLYIILYVFAYLIIICS